jgi:hypothetical protein
MLDGYSTGSSNGNFASALSDIASGFVVNLAQAGAGALSGRVEGAINNAPRSSNTAPTPDVTAIAARPDVSTFTSATAFGVSLPLLLVGGGALLFLALRK